MLDQRREGRSRPVSDGLNTPRPDVQGGGRGRAVADDDVRAEVARADARGRRGEVVGVVGAGSDVTSISDLPAGGSRATGGRGRRDEDNVSRRVAAGNAATDIERVRSRGGEPHHHCHRLFGRRVVQPADAGGLVGRVGDRVATDQRPAGAERLQARQRGRTGGGRRADQDRRSGINRPAGVVVPPAVSTARALIIGRVGAGQQVTRQRRGARSPRLDLLAASGDAQHIRRNPIDT